MSASEKPTTFLLLILFIICNRTSRTWAAVVQSIISLFGLMISFMAAWPLPASYQKGWYLCVFPWWNLQNWGKKWKMTQRILMLRKRSQFFLRHQFSSLLMSLVPSVSFPPKRSGSSRYICKLHSPRSERIDPMSIVGKKNWNNNSHEAWMRLRNLLHVPLMEREVLAQTRNPNLATILLTSGTWVT